MKCISLAFLSAMWKTSRMPFGKPESVLEPSATSTSESTRRSLPGSPLAAMIEESIDETLAYYEFPREHWRRIRTNDALERLFKEVRRRTRVVSAFPDGNSALMLVAARLRHVSGSSWGSKKYLNIERLREQQKEKEYSAKFKCAKDT